MEVALFFPPILDLFLRLLFFLARAFFPLFFLFFSYSSPIPSTFLPLLLIYDIYRFHKAFFFFFFPREKLETTVYTQAIFLADKTPLESSNLPIQNLSGGIYLPPYSTLPTYLPICVYI